MSKDSSRNWRFAGLGALTATFAGGIAASRKVWSGADVVPEVDALHQPPPGGGEWPFVSIIVPARNEERNLAELLSSLLSQRYPSYEVIVVDDQSEDTTPVILEEWARRDSKLKVVRGGELPRDEGWMGKPHAMQQGSQAASGDWLVFTDADTRHEPLALSSCVAYALGHDIDLFSIMPCLELVTPAERLIMPVTFMGIMWLYPPYKVNDPSSSVAIANGQYILIRRAVYDAVGGSARVKGEIVEDLEFAKAVKSDGFRLFVADGRHLVSVRMYTSLAEIWEGWSKNTVIAIRKNPRTLPLSVLGLILMTAGPLLMIRWGISSWKRALRTHQASDRVAAGWITSLVLFNLGAYLEARRHVDKELGLPIGWTFTQPVGGFVFALILLSSVLRLVTGKGVVWKGRIYHDS